VSEFELLGPNGEPVELPSPVYVLYELTSPGPREWLLEAVVRAEGKDLRVNSRWKGKNKLKSKLKELKNALMETYDTRDVRMSLYEEQKEGE